MRQNPRLLQRGRRFRRTMEQADRLATVFANLSGEKFLTERITVLGDMVARAEGQMGQHRAQTSKNGGS